MEDWATDGNVYRAQLDAFIKRFRKNTNMKIKYYGVGEYGTHTKRPHYHLIIFLKVDVSIRLMQKEVARAWVEDKKEIGHIRVDLANEARLHYITKYHITKPFTPKNCMPSFTCMSRRPFIGSDYVEKMRKHHEGNINNMYVSHFGKKQAMPRIYKQKLYTEEERQEAFEKLNEKRKEDDYKKVSKVEKAKKAYKLLNKNSTREDFHDLQVELRSRLYDKYLQIIKQNQL